MYSRQTNKGETLKNKITRSDNKRENSSKHNQMDISSYKTNNAINSFSKTTNYQGDSKANKTNLIPLLNKNT
jgi:hypothetical protein